MNRYIINIILCYNHISILNGLSTVLNGPYHPPPTYKICSSLIYCQGDLLRIVQTAKLFPTSKTFVDLKILRNETLIVDEFNELNKLNNGSIPTSLLKTFVSHNFAVDYLDKWEPPDFKVYPPIIDYVKDIEYKEFLLRLNQMWKNLARKVSKTVNDAYHRHSMIYVPNGFFVNMEHQQDFNYWDAYWIIRGALICGMEKTVKGILENFIYMVRKYGYVLYGNRKYYEGRSQPPLLTQMMATYYSFTNDKSFINDNIQRLDDEMMFWLVQRKFDVRSSGNVYGMIRYTNKRLDPRPEMYNIDLNIAKTLNNRRDENEFYCRVKAASESGWGFSSKHFHDRHNYNDVRKTLLKTNPLNYAYVDLNSIMQSNAKILSKLYLLSDNTVNSEYYKNVAQRIQIGINALLWNEDEQMWLDYDTSTGENRNYFYASNLAPLWTESYDKKLSEYYGDVAVNYLIRNNIINNDLTPRVLCVPTSLYNTGLDWDYHNCWPQLQSMVIFGLQSTKSKRAQKVALNLANSWVKTNFVGYNKSRTLFEKYNAVKIGHGSQFFEKQPKGYGVTLGLLFQIFHEFGNLLESIN